MAENDEVTFPCPGKDLHEGEEGECEFCKETDGNPRVVEGMPEIDRITGNRLVDPCCKACANNLKRASDNQYVETSVS